MNQDEILTATSQNPGTTLLEYHGTRIQLSAKNSRGHPGRSAGISAWAATGVETGPNAGDFALGAELVMAGPWLKWRPGK